MQIKPQRGITSHPIGRHCQKHPENASVGEDVEKLKSFCPVVGIILVYGAVAMKNSMEASQIIKNRTTIYDPAISLLSMYAKELKKDLRNSCTAMFTAELFTIAKVYKQPKCPSTDEWIKKMWYIHTMAYYSAFKKKKILSCARTWMNLKDIMLSEIRQSQKDIWHDSTYMRYLK